jgi:hypothetical protein
VQQLHLVGLTTDLDGLIFSTRRNARSGSYVVALDDALLATIADVLRKREGERPQHAATAQLIAQAAGLERRPQSALSLREIQARLRAGRTVEEVAAEAGVDPDWVERFAVPIRAEQQQVIAQAGQMVYTRPRVGVSAQPLAVAVRWNLAERGVRLSAGEMARAWRAWQVHDSVWLVRLEYRSRGRPQVADWELDVRAGTLSARNRLASQLAYVEPKRRPPALDDLDDEGVPAAPPGPAPATPRRRAGAAKRAPKTASAAKPKGARTTTRRTSAGGAATTAQRGRRAAATPAARSARAKTAATSRATGRAAPARTAEGRAGGRSAGGARSAAATTTAGRTRSTTTTARRTSGSGSGPAGAGRGGAPRSGAATSASTSRGARRAPVQGTTATAGPAARAATPRRGTTATAGPAARTASAGPATTTAVVATTKRVGAAASRQPAAPARRPAPPPPTAPPPGGRPAPPPAPASAAPPAAVAPPRAAFSSPAGNGPAAAPPSPAGNGAGGTPPTGAGAATLPVGTTRRPRPLRAR